MIKENRELQRELERLQFELDGLAGLAGRSPELAGLAGLSPELEFNAIQVRGATLPHCRWAHLSCFVCEGIR